MKVLCPVKRVVDPFAKVKPLPDGTALDTSNVKFDLNPFDEIAVEEAVRMKEKDPSVSVTAVSIGGAEAEEQLRKALAMGADQAVLVENDRPLDPGVVAKELAALAKDFDLVLMGKQATDDDNGQVAQRLAAILGWPQATFASSIVIEAGRATVVRETDTGEETLSLPLPCVVTADLRLNQPRYIALPGIVKARSKPLERRPRATQDAPKLRTESLAAPPPRPQGVKVQSVDELIAALRQRGVV